MEKRLILAISLSIFVIILWSAVTSKPYRIGPQNVTVQEPLATSASVVPQLREEKFLFQEQEYTFVLPRAAIKEVLFKNYHNYRFILADGLFLGGADLCTKQERFGNTTTFLFVDAEKKITKQFIFSNSNYSNELKIKIQNLKSQTLQLRPELILAKLNFANTQFDKYLQEVVVGYQDRLVRSSARSSMLPTEEIQFFVLRDRYFCAIITPTTSGCKGFIRNRQNRETELGVTFDASLAPQEEKEFIFKVYIGPQESRLLAALNPQWAAIIHYGRFDKISLGLLKILEFFHKIFNNWGLALIMLSVAIYFLLYPLTIKQLRAMKKMQELQPQIEQLRKEYKNNPQKLNKDILELYRRERVNPLGGCLPFVLQIPIFFALYQGLIRFFPLKGAHFLWITDLSEPDRLFILSRALPMLGNEINALPIFMAGIMFFQQKFTQNPTVTTNAAEQQRIMSIILPFLFAAIFYRMPSGLVLYWTVNTLLMLLQQVLIRRQHQ